MNLTPLVLALLLVATPAFSEEFREFTSADGSKKLSAKIDSQAGDKFTITLKNGRTLSVQASAFSKDDQAFFKEWSANNISYNFSIEADRSKSDTRKKKESNWTYTIDTVGYKVTIENSSSTPLEGLEVRYMVFKDEQDPHNTSRSSALTTSHSASYEIESLEAKSEITFESETVEITEGELDAGWRVPGGKNKYNDRLSGLWIKVFHKNKEVHEFKTKDSALKDARWKGSNSKSRSESESEE